MSGYGFRKLNNNVGFTIVAIACLALGICASITVFSVVDALLLRPFPGVKNPGRIVSLAAKPRRIAGLPGDEYSPALNYPAFQRYRSSNRAFTDLVAYYPLPLNLAGTGEPQRVSGQLVTDNYFKLLGLRARWGACSSPARGARKAAGGGHRLRPLAAGFRRPPAGDRQLDQPERPHLRGDRRRA